jgi:hypothetical protein
MTVLQGKWMRPWRCILVVIVSTRYVCKKIGQNIKPFFVKIMHNFLFGKSSPKIWATFVIKKMVKRNIRSIWSPWSENLVFTILRCLGSWLELKDLAAYLHFPAFKAFFYPVLLFPWSGQSGLPDFSRYNIPKWGEMYQNGGKYTKMGQIYQLALKF